MSVRRDRCPTCHRLKKRSNPANARYWLLLHMIAEKIKPMGILYSAEQYHEYFKQRYLGADEMVLPNGKAVNIRHSTADLDTQEFAEYMGKVEQWGIEHDVYLDELQPT